MKAYSVDLRQKIINVYETEKISLRILAERFCVTKTFVYTLIKKYKETGNIEPKPRGGNRPRKLNNEQIVILIEILESHNDSTLKELSQMLGEKTGVKVSITTIFTLLKKLNYTRKKNTISHRKKPRRCPLKKTYILARNKRY